MRWKNHENHREIIEELYANLKYLLTEQAKDSLLDAIECMKMADRLETTWEQVKDKELMFMDYTAGWQDAVRYIRGENDKRSDIKEIEGETDE